MNDICKLQSVPSVSLMRYGKYQQNLKPLLMRVRTVALIVVTWIFTITTTSTIVVVRVDGNNAFTSSRYYYSSKHILPHPIVRTHRSPWRKASIWGIRRGNHETRSDGSMISVINRVHRGGGGQSGGSGSSTSSGTGSATDSFFASNDVPRNLHLPSKNIVYESVLLTLQIVTTVFRTVLPPIVTTIRTIVDFYRILPIDAILAQIGLIYAFAGGYYPTLFAAVQAAQHCGYQNMITAIQVLVDEATTAIQACDFSSIKFTFHSQQQEQTQFNRKRAREIFTKKTKIVLATIDPVRINEAIAAIYTTWMSISIVLEREFARTIALSITIAESIQPMVSLLLNRPLQMCISASYYKWIPIIIGWVCKAMAMSLAWRIQRVLTAYTSAIAGGLMCARALCRIVQKQWGGIRRIFGFPAKQQKKAKFSATQDASSADPNFENTHLDEFLGYIIALCGLYSQIGQGFSFEVPFPLSLVTWPFDLAERWIQWQITRKRTTSE
jgi:hypothetical protein